MMANIADRSMSEIQVRGVIKNDELMSKHTSWGVGGPAEHYFEPADIDDLCNYLAAIPPSAPLMWLGQGSNLLVRDGGIKGTIIVTASVFNDLDLIQVDQVKVGAGVPCAKVARFCAKSGLTGAEFLAGIPGTMGGALAMNAGAFGGETWDIVISVETLNRKGQRRVRLKNEFDIEYRHVHLEKDEWFINSVLTLDVDTHRKSFQKIRQMLDQRAKTQPLGQASCGSVFRNPPDDYAARLIESCGLKGMHIGNACVSEEHANFIINMGGATASDIEQLILYIKDVVKHENTVDLICEVRIVGEV